MSIAVVVLMLITSMGIFGFLSKAHNDQNLVSGDVQSKIAIYDEKIKTAKENIEADRKQLKQMDEAVDQIMGRSSDEKGADKANAVRKSQQRDRASLAKDIETQQKLISSLNDEAAPIRAENRKVEAEVGPIKYIAAFLYGTAPDAGMLEQAVTWIIILIVIVFDPLAVIMLLGAQMTFGWAKEEQEKVDEPTIQELDTFVGEKPTPEELEVHPDEGTVEETVTADSTATIPDEEIPFPTTGAIPIEAWNAMIAEAEAEAEAEAKAKAKAAEVEPEVEQPVEEPKYQILPELQEHIDSTVEERVARGESYIDTDGAEVSLEDEDSKKKNYMIKDLLGRIQVKNRS